MNANNFISCLTGLLFLSLPALASSSETSENAVAAGSVSSLGNAASAEKALWAESENVLSAEALADTSRVVDLDELTVVAQPKEAGRLRSLPVSSSVLTGREMFSLGVNDLSSLSAYVPSLSIPSYGSRLTSSIYVRGIGSRTGSPAVGVYYDGMPLLCKSAINNHFYQTDRVDILRGPQGTLYGMNSEGGIVRIYSKNPLNYQGTDLRFSGSTEPGGGVELAHYHRPSEKLAFSTAGYYNGGRGFFRNANLGGRADLLNEAGGRARLIWVPTSRLTADLTADYQYVNQNGFAYGEYHPDTKTWDEPSMNIMNGYRRQMVNTAVNVAYDFGCVRLTSVTSYQHLADFMRMDQDYLPQDYLLLEQRERMNGVVQELTLSGHGHETWRHTSGVFLSHQWMKTDAPVFFGDVMNSRIIGAMGMPAAVAGAMTLTDNCVPGSFDTPFSNIGVYHETDLRLSDRLTVVLGLRYDYQRTSIDYDTEARFTLGYSGMMAGRPVETSHTFRSRMDGENSHEYHQLLPKFGVTYGMGRSGNIYATVSKGFRAGGYNLQMFSDIFQTEQRSLGRQLMQLMREDVTVDHGPEDYLLVNNTISYKPETSWSYEAGAHLNLFGNRVHADVAAYFMQIRNQQLSVMAANYGYGRMMVNAGRSSSLGAELSMRSSGFDGRMTWAASYGFVHSTFRSYTDVVSVHNGGEATGKTTNATGGTHEETRSYRGRYVPFIPRHTFSATADWRFPISTTGLLRSITLGADVSGLGKTWWDIDNTACQPFYATLGAHAVFHLGSVRVRLWGRNLTDTRYSTFLVSSSADGVGRQFAQRGLPVHGGVDINITLR